MEKNTSSRGQGKNIRQTPLLISAHGTTDRASHLGSTRFSWFGFQTTQGRLLRQGCLSLDSGLAPYGAGTRPPAAWACSSCPWPIPVNLPPQNKQRFTHTVSGYEAACLTEKFSPPPEKAPNKSKSRWTCRGDSRINSVSTWPTTSSCNINAHFNQMLWDKCGKTENDPSEEEKWKASCSSSCSEAPTFAPGMVRLFFRVSEISILPPRLPTCMGSNGAAE